MNAPRLAPFHEVRHQLGLPPLNDLAVGPQARLFAVVGDGRFMGRPFVVGDVVVCHGVARAGQQVVLVARGPGRPRVGTMGHDGLRGDAGERCGDVRWVSAGRLSRVLSPGEPAALARGRRSWGQAKVLSRRGPGQGGDSGRVGPMASTAARQLSLFAPSRAAV